MDGNKTLRRVDGGLHLFFGHIDGQREIELQHDDGSAAGAGGGHLAQALQFAELALQRRRHRRRHHSRGSRRDKT